MFQSYYFLFYYLLKKIGTCKPRVDDGKLRRLLPICSPTQSL